MQCQKRVILIHDGFGTLRGSEGVALDLIRGLQAGSTQWVIVTNHAEFASICNEHGLETHLIAFPDSGRIPLSIAKLRIWNAAFQFLNALITRFQPHILHINNGGSCHWVTLCGWRHHVPSLVHLHAPWSRRMRILRGLYLPDRVVGVSNRILDGFRTAPIVSKKLTTIYNGIDPRPPQSAYLSPIRRADLGIGPDHFVFAFVAVMIPEKRPHDAIAGIARLPQDIREKSILLMIGDGPQRQQLETQAKGLPVIFLGQRTDVAALMEHICNAIVLPSAIEAFSITLLEAARHGLPRIASDAGGNIESIEPKIDGFLHPLGDIDALADAMRQLVEDRDLAKHLGENARQRLSEAFSQTKFLTDFATLYEQMGKQTKRSLLQEIGTAALSTLQLLTRKPPNAP